MTKDVTDLVNKQHLIPAIGSHMRAHCKAPRLAIDAFVKAQFQKNGVPRLHDDLILKVIKRPYRTGLMQTATGYGRKLKTDYMVLCSDNRERRVYARCFSNVASLYVIIAGERFHVSDYQLECKQ